MDTNETPASAPAAPAMPSIALTPEEAANVISQLPPMRTPRDGYYDGGAGALFYADKFAAAVAAADKTKLVPRVPPQITADRARVELIARGKRAAIDAFLATLVDPDRALLSAIWEYRTAFARTDADFLRMLGGAGIVDVDEFFVAAAAR